MWVIDPVTCVTFTNDRQCIIVSSLDSTIRLLDKDTGELLNEFKGHRSKDYKIDCCSSNTDAHIISGSEDGRVCIWELVEVRLYSMLNSEQVLTHTHFDLYRHSQAKLVQSLPQGSETSVVYSLAFHPKESCLLAAASDGSIKVWKGGDRGQAS
jgi:mitogen-activated protein kinase organizer 1